MTTASTILKCKCGRQMAVPADAGGPAGARTRCPACTTEIAVPPAGKGPAAIGSSCPVCQTQVQQADTWARCGACGLVHHHECWTEVGGCGAYGCANAPDKPAGSKPAAANSAWGDTKECPVCNETIKSLAVKCRFCGAEFGTVDPVTSTEFMDRTARKTGSVDFRRGIVIVFVLSIFGFFAPLLLPVSIFVVCRRQKMKDAGPLYAALAYTGLGISALYSVLMVIFLLISL